MRNLLADAYRASKEIGQWAGAGFPTTELSKQRLAICEACPHYNAGRCAVCGCYMAAKTMMATSKCPVGKWEAVSAASATHRKCCHG